MHNFITRYERLSAYRFHTADPLVMSDGGKLNWRVGAQGKPGTTKCGNPLPSMGGGGAGVEDAVVWAELEAEMEAEMETRRGGAGAGRKLRLGRTLSPINVTTSAWVYTFPAEQ